MRIIGGHDYYDGAVGIAGRDPDILFLRNAPRSLSKDQMGLRTPPQPDIPGVVMAEIIVAGRRFTCAQIDDYRMEDGVNRCHTLTFHDEASLLAHCEPTQPKVPRWLRSLRVIHSEGLFSPREMTRQETERLVANRVVTAVWHPTIFKQAGREDEWLVDGPGLQDFDLARVLPPFEAFQAISMWISSTLPRNPVPMVTITNDRVIAGKHGFDERSFRKDPTKKKR